MMNTLKKELLEKNNKVLQGLHVTSNFNFNKAFNIVKIEGRFTFNSIKKSINVDLNNYNVALLITNRKYNEKYMYYINVSDNGFSLKKAVNWYNYNLDYFFSKGSFEETRKQDNIISYVVYQEKALEAVYKKPVINYNDRMKYINHIKQGVYNDPTKKGISSIDLKDVNNNKFTYKVRNNFASDNVNYFIDKSGYLLEGKKANLKQAAKNLRADREKEKVSIFDYSNKVINFNNSVETLKEKAITCIKNNNFSIAEKILHRIDWIMIDIKRFERDNNEKNFYSIDNVNKRIASIENTLKELFLMEA